MQNAFSSLNVQHKLKLLVSHPISTWNAIKLIWQNFSIPQRFYFLAVLILVTNEALGLVALVTTIALTLEFWPLFNRVWHSLAGKAVLLLFYAIVANFALAMSSSIVNEIVGVPAGHFTYTHNFAILLFLPAWIIVISAMALLCAQIIVPFYIAVALLLKPFGIQGWRLTQNTHYRIITMIVRFILSSILLYHVFLLLEDVEEIEDKLASAEIIRSSEINASPLNTKQLTTIDTLQVKDVASLIDTKKVSMKDEQTNRSQVPSDPVIYSQIRKTYQTQVRQLIAHFAFYLEADTRSRCKKLEESSIMELNDYEILEIIPDKQAPYHYRFETKRCISPAFPE
ncbi:hypothetical protein K0I73_09595 [Shewanella mesophila]|uniref:hypothetical protein n=1 Tax=Shewanella mesophila TaxID=2864208 RepID=UPI001C660ECB|nr:hypothetical protein [Shewanella mesophila]QYJ84539.1 hypothetical protein K0I73_09595 [Shewanella mesophila]